MLRNQSSTNTTLIEEIPLSLLRRRITYKCVVIPWYGIVLYLHGSRRGKFCGADCCRFFLVINLPGVGITLGRLLFWAWAMGGGTLRGRYKISSASWAMGQILFIML